MDDRGRVKRRSKRAPRAVQEKSPYEILEVSETAAFEEIRKAYLAKVRLSPPERNPEGFKVIQKAYAVLKDAVRRKAFDLSLFRKELAAGTTVDMRIEVGALFRDRVFRVLLASSDLYLKDFSRFFASMDEEVRHLS
jgi:curved DNA-binding protein CbpA